MTTWRELIYMVLDEVKMSSDDSIYTTDHIKFLLSKYRGYILNATYSSIKKEIPESNYQNICIDVTARGADFCGGETVLVSDKPIPYTMTIGRVLIYPPAGFMYGRINFVSQERFKWVGHNRFLRNELYATIGPDSRLYIKGSNSNFLYLRQVRMSALFQSPEDAAELECNANDFNSTDCSEVDTTDNCDILDKDFPLEEAYIATLIQLVVRDLVSTIYRPSDEANNANDDLSDISSFIRMNMKDKYLKNATPEAIENE